MNPILIGAVQVLLLVGVVAGAGWPSWWASHMEAKETSTRQSMRETDKIMYRRTETGAFPETLANQVLDGWGRPLRYVGWDGGYALISGGADGVLDANSRELLELVQQPVSSAAVTEYLSRAANAQNLRPRRAWAESFDDDIISVSGSFAFDHPRRLGVIGDAPASVIGEGWVAAGCFFTVFLMLTIYDYRRSYTS